MQNAGDWNPAVQKRIEPLPGHSASLAATTQNRAATVGAADA